MRVLSETGRLFVTSWIVALLAIACGVLVLGCAPRLQETQIRRADSLGDVDAIADEQAPEGWHVVDVEAMDGGSFVVVLARDGGAQ